MHRRKRNPRQHLLDGGATTTTLSSSDLDAISWQLDVVVDPGDFENRRQRIDDRRGTNRRLAVTPSSSERCVSFGVG